MALELTRLPGPPAEHGPHSFGPSPTGPRPRRHLSGGRRWVAIASIGLAAALAAALVVPQLDGHEQHGSAAAPTVAIPAGDPTLAGACVDRSYGMHRLGTSAIRATQRVVGTYGGEGGPVPRSRPVPAVPGLDLTARVVRPDSYTTLDPLNRGVHVRVTGTPGLRTAEPTVDRPDYPAAVDAYDTAHASTERGAAHARTLRRRAADRLGELARVVSDGSDVTGCVFGLVRDLPADRPVRLLLVSDLGDTRLTTPDGRPRGFAGDLSRVHLTTVLACPSGDPAACQRRYRGFLDRLAPFGLDPRQSRVYGPGQVERAVADWLSGARDR